MMRSIGWMAGILIFAGLGYSAWHLYDWWDGRQSVYTIDSAEERTPEKLLEEQPSQTTEMVEQSPQIEMDFSTLNINRNKGEEVATLTIPKLGLSYDVFWGTDENTLGQGVGMYVSEWTTVPNLDGGHTVLSGHRDTVFTKLAELGEGDTLTVEYQGQEYNYRIKKTWITDPDDRTVIVDKDDPTLTLTTCYPFQYIGPAPERYILQAELE